MLEEIAPTPYIGRPVPLGDMAGLDREITAEQCRAGALKEIAQNDFGLDVRYLEIGIPPKETLEMIVLDIRKSVLTIYMTILEVLEGKDNRTPGEFRTNVRSNPVLASVAQELADSEEAYRQNTGIAQLYTKQ